MECCSCKQTMGCCCCCCCCCCLLLQHRLPQPQPMHWQRRRQKKPCLVAPSPSFGREETPCCCTYSGLRRHCSSRGRKKQRRGTQAPNKNKKTRDKLYVNLFSEATLPPPRRCPMWGRYLSSSSSPSSSTTTTTSSRGKAQLQPQDQRFSEQQPSSVS